MLFQKDLSGVDRLRNTLQDVAGRAIQFQTQRAELQRQREEDSYINNVITRTKERLSPQQQDVSQLPVPTSDPNRLAPYREAQPGEALPEGTMPIRRTRTVEPTDIERNQAYDEAELALLRRRPSERMNQAVAAIGRMRTRPDQSTTLEDDRRAGRITDEQYMRFKHGDQTQTGKYTYTPRLDASGNPVTKQFGNDVRILYDEIDRRTNKPTGNSKYETGGNVPNQPTALDMELKQSLIDKRKEGKQPNIEVTRFIAPGQPSRVQTYHSLDELKTRKHELETLGQTLGSKENDALGMDWLAKDANLTSNWQDFVAGKKKIAEVDPSIQTMAAEYTELNAHIQRLEAGKTTQPAATAPVQAPAGKIRIRFKSDAYGQKKGATGAIHPSEFDPTTMEKFQ